MIPHTQEQETVESKSRVQTKDRERPFMIEELFFSTTDVHGKLTSWNDTFQRISGFDHEELDGAPHSLIRHPDMPRAVFQLLWDTIQDGKSIGAYVKNRSKDGSYYWVYALAMPIENGYLSIRLKPTSSVLSIVKGLYQELLDYEKSLIDEGMKKADCAKKSKRVLLEKLAGIGFPNYESFMEATLPVELSQRNAALRGQTQAVTTKITESAGLDKGARVALIREHLNVLFNQFYLALELSKKIKDDFACIQELGSAIMLGSLNASIEAARLGETGRVLHVLADYLGTSGNAIIRELSEAQVRCHESLSDISQILFVASAALLETEICTSFFAQNQEESEEYQVDRTKVLLSSFQTGIARVVHEYPKLENALNRVIDQFKEIQKLFLSLKIAQVSAKAEANRLSINTHFKDVFEKVYTFVDSAKDKISHVNNEIEQYVSELLTKASSHQAIKNAIAGLGEDVQ